MRQHITVATCVLTAFALSSPARGGSVVGPGPDFIGDATSTNFTVKTHIKIPVNPFLDIEIAKDEITIKLLAAAPPLPLSGVAYFESQTPDFSGDLTVTTIYGIDQNPAGSGLQVTGVDPVSPEFQPTSPETIFGSSGTHYTSSFSSMTAIGDLSALLGPGYDLSPFAAGDPNSDVYVFRTIVPSTDLLVGVPEPSSALMCAIGAATVVALALSRRRRTGMTRRFDQP